MGGAETKLSLVGGVPRELHLGDAIHFFLSAKRAGGRSERTLDDRRKKLELFQRWLAARFGGEDAVDATYSDIDANGVEAYATIRTWRTGLAARRMLGAGLWRGL